jgi:hypothetical protein
LEQCEDFVSCSFICTSFFTLLDYRLSRNMCQLIWERYICYFYHTKRCYKAADDTCRKNFGRPAHKDFPGTQHTCYPGEPGVPVPLETPIAEPCLICSTAKEKKPYENLTKGSQYRRDRAHGNAPTKKPYEEMFRAGQKYRDTKDADWIPWTNRSKSRKPRKPGSGRPRKPFHELNKINQYRRLKANEKLGIPRWVTKGEAGPGTVMPLSTGAGPMEDLTYNPGSNLPQPFSFSAYSGFSDLPKTPIHYPESFGDEPPTLDELYAAPAPQLQSPRPGASTTPRDFPTPPPPTPRQ